MTVPSPFTERERSLWAPPRRLMVSEWADRFRRLPSTDPQPGPWRTPFTEYWREPMDSINDPVVEEVVIEAGAQTGKSRVLENILGYVVCEDPADILLVVARDRDVRDVVRSRLKAMIEDSPALRAQLSESAQDVGLESLRFRRCTVFTAASNSSAGLASKSCRFVLLDEIGKWPSVLANEGSPIDLARQRTNAFAGRRKIVAVSSPTTEKHGIHPEYLRTDRRRWHVPCPECDHFQPLRWEQVKFEGRDPDEILLRPELVRYECENCGARWSDAEKRLAVRDGVWVPEGARVDAGGELVDVRPSVARGYHVPGILSPIRPMADLVARWLRAQGERGKLGVFFRSELGVPWQDVGATVEPADIEELRGDYVLGEIPKDCTAEFVFAGLDVGERVVHWVIRAFAPGMESWLVARGLAVNLTEAVATVLDGDWGLPLRRACVDSGYDTSEVYRVCASRRGLLVPVKGASYDEPGNPVRVTTVDHRPDGRSRRRAVKLRTLDTGYFKDSLIGLQDRGAWHLPDDIDQDYLEQLASEAKVLDEKGRERWEVRQSGAPNHFLDAEVYALAAAHIEGLWRGEGAPNRRAARRESGDGASAARRVVSEPDPAERRVAELSRSRGAAAARGRGARGLAGRRARGGRRGKPFGGGR